MSAFEILMYGLKNSTFLDVPSWIAFSIASENSGRVSKYVQWSPLWAANAILSAPIESAIPAKILKNIPFLNGTTKSAIVSSLYSALGTASAPLNNALLNVLKVH